ncbi:hypothetical protein BST27_24105 [Mycobacterium intermedium]|uniref:Type II secretion system protein GspF domain-containing protein n=1 Tax=Mycobacterium intermedium TaxID=28445 RepID=A0A1E3SJY1_MYCIE|nr:type II secretion system F family protein [Mycobacterium intermedium]MCV6965562.1 type II secretion system F family protein [Mycobacterium intermedium]ODR02470.1 hypothetical protein BHQ20_05215 [Mycobacterium intermedium]OPE51590.1 hypothetical protein BV508_05605 [Mycobacterium intermedium]ORA96775.1 hypothetical protein BST27_24105 [Mycobacterium intermedium]
MIGLQLATVLLSLALLVSPSSPRRRLPAGLDKKVLPGRRAACGLAAGVCVIAVVSMPVTSVLSAAVLGTTVGVRYRRRRRARCRVREGRALEAALDVLVGELRVGAHPVNAFDVAAKETIGPVGDCLRAVAARARLGADVATGLRTVATASVLPAYWERLAVCWQLANDHGLAIAALMRAAQRDIAERQRFSDRVTSGLAGARATAAILAGLPVLGMLLGQLLGARPLAFLLGVGGWVLVSGLLLACSGLLWADRITDRVAM